MDIEDITIDSTTVKDHTTTIRIAKYMIADMIKMYPSNNSSSLKPFDVIMREMARKYKHIIGKQWLSTAYKELSDEYPTVYPKNHSLRYFLMKKAIRSASGIVNVSVVMPPDRFSCKFNCRFCPNETIANGASVDMPRSYLSNEDAVRRAASVGFDAEEQVWVRFRALERNGHPIDKIEFRILGGTFSCYDRDVADTFMRDLYYAANTYYDSLPRRERLSVDEEQKLNVSAKIHVVGVGIETRPDMINLDEIVRLRNYGVTRVELGVQHTNDNLLRKMNRGHLVKHSKDAIRLLKEYGFKVEIHIMTDLPGATPEMDKECYRLVLQDDPDLIPDYMKDYPCQDVSFTEVKKWKEDGRWTPYAEQTPDGSLLKDVLVYRQTITPKWVRVNRIQRDFLPAREGNNFLGFTSSSIPDNNLGDVVTRLAEKQGIYCQCIRCREIGNEKFEPSEIQYFIDSFQASGAQEFYICAEVPRPNRNLLLGFIRLRLCDSLEKSVIPELVGKTAMIRELHVYGQVKAVGEEGSGNGAQHLGIGRTLLKIAERISRDSEYKQIAIISGIGVRDYYRKNGYELRGTYMMKQIGSSLREICDRILFHILFVGIAFALGLYFG